MPGNFSLQEFVKVGDETLIEQLTKPLIGQVSVIDAVTNYQTNVILNGGDNKKIVLVVHKNRDDVYESLKFRQRQFVLIKAYGLKSMSENGPLAITWESGSSLERIGQTALNNLDLYEQNKDLCTGVVVLKEFKLDEQRGCLTMKCADHLGRSLTFRAYNSPSGSSMLSTLFFDVLLANNAQRDDFVKIANFCVVPLASGGYECRLRKDSKLGFFSKHPVQLHGNSNGAVTNGR